MGLDNPLHIAFLLVVLLLVFGAKRLPEMGHSLGSGLRGFRDAISGGSADAPATPSALTWPGDGAQPQTAAQLAEQPAQPPAVHTAGPHLDVAA